MNLGEPVRLSFGLRAQCGLIGLAVFVAVLAALLGAMPAIGQSSSQNMYGPQQDQRPDYPMTRHPFAFGVHVGTNGLGGDFTAPITPRIDARVGADFFAYATTLQEQGVNVDGSMRLLSTRATLDWYPTRHPFRISPLLMFANTSHVAANVVLPPTYTWNLYGYQFISSPTDPIQGHGRVDLPRTSPGLTVGFGRTLPRRRLSFPVELGFYYAGEPKVGLEYSGSVCNASLPGAGCEPVAADAQFQQSIARLRVTAQKDANYVRFYPILSSGVSFSF